MGREKEREREETIYITIYNSNILPYIIIWRDIVISNIRTGFCCNIISHICANFYI